MKPTPLPISIPFFLLSFSAAILNLLQVTGAIETTMNVGWYILMFVVNSFCSSWWICNFTTHYVIYKEEKKIKNEEREESFEINFSFDEEEKTLTNKLKINEEEI